MNTTSYNKATSDDRKHHNQETDISGKSNEEIDHNPIVSIFIIISHAVFS